MPTHSEVSQFLQENTLWFRLAFPFMVASATISVVSLVKAFRLPTTEETTTEEVPKTREGRLPPPPYTPIYYYYEGNRLIEGEDYELDSSSGFYPLFLLPGQFFEVVGDSAYPVHKYRIHYHAFVVRNNVHNVPSMLRLDRERANEARQERWRREEEAMRTANRENPLPEGVPHSIGQTLVLLDIAKNKKRQGKEEPEVEESPIPHRYEREDVVLRNR